MNCFEYLIFNLECNINGHFGVIDPSDSSYIVSAQMNHLVEFSFLAYKHALCDFLPCLSSVHLKALVIFLINRENRD